MPKAQCAANVFSSACPSRRVMAVLAEKWTLLIVTQLANGPMRTAEIRRGVDGVSEKMLIQTLRKLEGFGLISRKSYPEVPPRVEYRLTPLGRSLSRLAGLVQPMGGAQRREPAEGRAGRRLKLMLG